MNSKGLQQWLLLSSQLCSLASIDQQTTFLCVSVRNL